MDVPKLPIVIFLLLCGCASGIRPTNLPDVEAQIRREFPDVRQISGESLAAWMDDSSRTPPMLMAETAPIGKKRGS